MDGDTNLKGVKGWLLFLVLVLTLIGPLRVAWGVHSELEAVLLAEPTLAGTEEWFDIQGAAWVAWGVPAILSLTAGFILILVRKSWAVFAAIALLWLMGPLLAAFMIWDSGLEFDRTNLIAIAKPTASAVLWTLYLMISKRVKNTYDFRGWQKDIAPTDHA
jgi:hypothetical protein